MLGDKWASLLHEHSPLKPIRYLQDQTPKAPCEVNYQIDTMPVSFTKYGGESMDKFMVSIEINGNLMLFSFLECLSIAMAPSGQNTDVHTTIFRLWNIRVCSGTSSVSDPVPLLSCEGVVCSGKWREPVDRCGTLAQGDWLHSVNGPRGASRALLPANSFLTSHSPMRNR